MTPKHVQKFIDYLCKTYNKTTVIIDISEFHKEFKQIQDYFKIGSEDSNSLRLDLEEYKVLSKGTATESLWYFTNCGRYSCRFKPTLVTKEDLYKALGAPPKCLRRL